MAIEKTNRFRQPDSQIHTRKNQLSFSFFLPIQRFFPTYRTNFSYLSAEFLPAIARIFALGISRKNYGVSKTKQIDNQEKDIIAGIKIPAVSAKLSDSFKNNKQVKNYLLTIRKRVEDRFWGYVNE